MVPSKLVRRSLASGVELGDVENVAVHIRDTSPASRLLSSEGGGDPGEGCSCSARWRCFLALVFAGVLRCGLAAVTPGN